MTQDMLSITDAAYASLQLEQNDFQASEATLKVPGLYPLNTDITGSTDTLGSTLTNLPDSTACNYLFCSIEPLSPQNNVIFLCLNRQYTSYTSNLITSLFPTLALLYPDIQKTEVWITPNQHTSTSTLSEILASSNFHLQTVMTFNPYNNCHVHQTPTPDSDLPPTCHVHPNKHPNQQPRGKPNPSPRQQASTSPQSDQNSWTIGPYIQPNNQPTILSITIGSTFTETAGNQLLLSLQAKVAALSLRLGPDNPPTNQALLTAVTALLNQSLSHLPALIELHIHATLQSPSFSAAVTTSIHTELLSLQPPCSCTS